MHFTAVSLGEHIVSLDLPTMDLFSLKIAGRDHAFPPILTRGTLRHNLPSRGHPFIGRYQETAVLMGSTEEFQITTLVGPPGVGKSALAWRAGIEWLDHAFGNAWLLRVREESTLETLRADLLNAAYPQSIAGTELCQAFGGGRHLVLLDGCDQAIEACLALIPGLISVGPGISLVATARAPLGIPEENTIIVGPMALPPLSGTVDDLLECESVRLFLSQIENLGGCVNPRSLGDVAQIIHWIKGNPSDVIAAATHAASYGLEVVVNHLNLQVGDTAPRLSVEEGPFAIGEEAAQFLARLSVLCPTWDSRAASAISGLSLDQTNAFLRQLSDAGLLEVGYSPGRQIRFSTPGSATVFGAHRLDPSDRFGAESRHIAYFLRFAEETLRTAVDVDAELNAIQEEYPNVRLALSRAIASGSVDAARFLRPLSRFWHRRKPPLEALGLCRAVCDLQNIELSDHAATAFNVTGTFLSASGHLPDAAAFHERSFSIAESRGDGLAAGLAQSNLVGVHTQLGDLASAVEAGRASVERLSTAGDPAGLARALNNLTTILHETGNLEEAQSNASRALQLAQELSDSWLECHCYGNLAEIAFDAGRTAAAFTSFGKEFRLAMEIDEPRAIALAIEGLGRLEVGAQNWSRASWLLRVAHAYRGHRELYLSEKLTVQLEALRLQASEMADDDEGNPLGDADDLSRVAKLFL